MYVNVCKSVCVREKETCHDHFFSRTTVKASIILLPLLGLTWVIGLFFANTDTTAFAWIFTGINSLQVEQYTAINIVNVAMGVCQ